MDKSKVIAWLRQQTDKTFLKLSMSAVGRGPDECDRAWREAHVIVGWAVIFQGREL